MELTSSIKFSWNPVPVSAMGSRTDFSHISEMFDDTKMRSRLYPFFHIARLNDFSSFPLYMSDWLFESANGSTDSTSLCCVVSPEFTVVVEQISEYAIIWKRFKGGMQCTHLWKKIESLDTNMHSITLLWLSIHYVPGIYTLLVCVFWIPHVHTLNSSRSS